MKNKAIRMKFLMVMVLFLLEIGTFYVCYNFFHISSIWAIMAIMVVGLIVYSSLFMIVLSMLMAGSEKRFVRRYNNIVNKWGDHQDAARFLRELQSMPTKPITEGGRSAYMVSMSTAYVKLSDYDNALRCLSEIKTTDSKMLSIIESEKKTILKMKEKAAKKSEEIEEAAE